MIFCLILSILLGIMAALIADQLGFDIKGFFDANLG